MSETPLLDTLRAAREAGDPARLVTTIPYMQWMGIEIELAHDAILGIMRYQDMLVGNVVLPALHGGTLGALLESTAVFTLLWARDAEQLPKTITLTVDYLRPARPEDTFAEAIITRHGKRVANVRAEAWQRDERDRLIATANAHFLL